MQPILNTEESRWKEARVEVIEHSLGDILLQLDANGVSEYINYSSAKHDHSTVYSVLLVDKSTDIGKEMGL